MVHVADPDLVGSETFIPDLTRHNKNRNDKKGCIKFPHKNTLGKSDPDPIKRFGSAALCLQSSKNLLETITLSMIINCNLWQVIPPP